MLWLPPFPPFPAHECAFNVSILVAVIIIIIVRVVVVVVVAMLCAGILRPIFFSSSHCRRVRTRNGVNLSLNIGPRAHVCVCVLRAEVRAWRVPAAAASAPLSFCCCSSFFNVVFGCWPVPELAGQRHFIFGDQPTDRPTGQRLVGEVIYIFLCFPSATPPIVVRSVVSRVWG